jgi:hypothetical protein
LEKKKAWANAWAFLLSKWEKIESWENTILGRHCEMERIVMKDKVPRSTLMAALTSCDEMREFLDMYLTGKK